MAIGVETQDVASLHHVEGIDLLHEAVGFQEGDDDLLDVADVLEAEGAPAPIFEPLLRGLVATDVEFPGAQGDVVEVLLVVDPHPPDAALRGRFRYQVGQLEAGAAPRPRRAPQALGGGRQLLDASQIIQQPLLRLWVRD